MILRAALLAAAAWLAAPPALAHEEEQDGFAAPPLALTPVQRQALVARPVLKLGVESDWPPIEYFDEKGQYSGVLSSYMHALEHRLGVRFEVVSKATWQEVLDAFGRGEIDVISALGPSAEREKSMRFTQGYISFTDALIVRSGEAYAERLKDFSPGKRLAVVRGYGASERAVVAHPHLVPVPVDTSEQALFAVAAGKADIAIAPLASAYQLIQAKGLTSLRVAANFDEFQQPMAMAFRPGLEALVPAFNAALASIPPGEQEAMRARWTKVQVDRGFSRSTVIGWTVLGVLVMVVMAVWLVWLLTLYRRSRHLRERAEAAESRFRAMLDAMPALFWTLTTEPGQAPVVEFFSERAMRTVGFDPAKRVVNFEMATRFMSADDRRRFETLLGEHAGSMTPLRFEHEQVGSAGRWAYVQAVPRREGRTLVWYGSTLDVSDRKVLEKQLEASHRRLRELASGVPGALWQFRREADGSQAYSYMSEGIVDITGRTPEETNALMKDKSFVSVYPEDLPILQGLMKRLMDKHGIEEARYRLHHKGGGYRWVQVAARAMPPEADGAIVWNGVTVDATRMHETEEALREEQQRLREVADSVTGAIWRLRRKADGSGVYFDYFSEGIVNVTGRTAAEMTDPTRPPFRDVADDDRARIAALLKRSAEDGTPVETEYTVLDKNGEPVRLFARGGVRFDQGEPVWTGVLLNVTERHQLTAQLAEARTRLEDVAANFPGAVFQMISKAGEKSRYTYVSEGITHLTGRPPRTQDGRETLENLDNIHPDDRPLVETVTGGLKRASGSAQFDYRLIHADGTPRWVHCALTSRAQPDESVVFNGLLLDAGEAKRMESELRGASERAEAASRAKSRFLANMSHEIRTPMNAVIGLAHLAMTSEKDPAQAERIGKIHRAGKGLLKLLNDILEYSRLDAGKFSAFSAPFDLDEIKENLKLFSLPAAEAKGIGFAIDTPGDLPLRWQGDATRIQQVLLNLITNAIKFTDAGGVVLHARPLQAPECGLHFEVRDTGIGMSAEQLSRVFEAFEQASGDTERRYGGTGLGLSICREIVRALGGQIEAASTQGVGTVFTVRLPLLPAAAPSAPPAPGRSSPALAERVRRLATHIANRETGAVRAGLQALKLILLPLGRGGDTHALEKHLNGYDYEAAQIELARLAATWEAAGAAPR